MERFWTKVRFGRLDECWLWSAGKDAAGYGRFSLGGRLQSAHRMAYTLMRGPIPSGLTINHLCRVRACCNPWHMEPTTIRENIQRGGNARKTHCKWGHPFSPENTYIMPSGSRFCRICGRRRTQEYLAKRRSMS